jgi:hypothetical protein
LNAAWRAELLAPPAPPAPPAPAAPAGGGPAGLVDVPPLPAPGGGVRPCFFRHCSNEVRLALEPPVEEADAEVEVVLELLVELLPHAASARAAMTAASAGISRRRVLLGEFM